jgi:hypothetical protein
VTNEVDDYLGAIKQRVGDAAQLVHETLLALGCSAYVKTIYIGYEIAGEMVAALYGRSDHIEVALALSDTEEHGLLIDGSHLTWPTLALAAVIRTTGEAVEAQGLLERAAERVRTRTHDVRRDSDYFKSVRARRRQ